MLDPGQGLSEEVGDVVPPRHMLHAELVALDAVLQPIESHIDAFRQARRHRLVGQDHGDLIVTEEEGGGLRVPQIVENGALVVG